MLPLMAKHGATWTMSPPGLATEYLSHPAFDDAVARLGTWVLTAARVPRPVFDELTGRGVHVTQAFGMSEGLFLFTPLDAPADLRAETVGVPVVPPESCSTAGPWTSSDAAISSSSAFSFPLISRSCRSSICINALSGAAPTVTSCRIAGSSPATSRASLTRS